MASIRRAIGYRWTGRLFIAGTLLALPACKGEIIGPSREGGVVLINPFVLRPMEAYFESSEFKTTYLVPEDRVHDGMHLQGRSLGSGRVVRDSVDGRPIKSLRDAA